MARGSSSYTTIQTAWLSPSLLICACMYDVAPCFFCCQSLYGLSSYQQTKPPTVSTVVGFWANSALANTALWRQIQHSSGIYSSVRSFDPPTRCTITTMRGFPVVASHVARRADRVLYGSCTLDIDSDDVGSCVFAQDRALAWR